MPGPGISFNVLAKELLASEEQQQARELTGNRMWDVEVKGSIKEILHKHDADTHLALPLPCAGLQVSLTGP